MARHDSNTILHIKKYVFDTQEKTYRLLKIYTCVPERIQIGGPWGSGPPF